VILTLDGDHDGDTNMARDTELLRRAEQGETIARIYGWTALWVTLGRFQRPETTLVEPKSTPHTVRPTGGAAVLHGHDLTVAIAMPIQRSVKGTYRVATEPLIAALNAAGVPAILAEDIGADDGDPARIDCFAGSSANDIVHRQTRQKACGCALRRTHTAVLLQASIPTGLPLAEPASIIKGGVLVPPVTLDREVFVHALAAWEPPT